METDIEDWITSETYGMLACSFTVQLYESEQFTRGCCSVQLVVIFSTRTSTRPSYRVPFLISSFLKTILLLKMSSGKFISFHNSVN